MKYPLQSLLVLVLASLVIYQSFFQRKALDEARLLSHQLALHLDTLQLISSAYEASHQQYVAVHRQLLHTQKRATHLSTELSEIASNQQAALTDIQVELKTLLAFDRQQLMLPEASIDSLLFWP